MFDYDSVRWKRLARMVMRRDGYMCQLSKRYGKAVPAEVVHHIFPVDEFPEYAYEPWNLIALSRKMHNTLHDRNTDVLTAEGGAVSDCGRRIEKRRQGEWGRPVKAGSKRRGRRECVFCGKRAVCFVQRRGRMGIRHVIYRFWLTPGGAA